MSTSQQSDQPTPATPSTPMVDRTLPLDSIVPYWRNPRKITDEAVNAVAESIKRYGYRQPIVVDSEAVIIVGHTRYAALRRLGYTEVPVKVATELTPRQVREFRAIDNRTAEYTSWDYDKLADELAALDDGISAAFFDMPTPDTDTHGPDGAADLPTSAEQVDETTAELICPSCFYSWEQAIREKDIRNGRIGADK